VKTSFQYVSVRNRYPTITYFQRLSPFDTVGFFSTSRKSKIEIKNELTDVADEDLKNFVDDTIFDHLYRQYFEQMNHLNFHTSPDNIYRYVQGAICACNVEPVVVTHIRCIPENTQYNFPEDGEKVRDLILVQKTRKGQILAEHGIAVVVRLLKSAENNQIDPSLPGLQQGRVETEEEFYVSISYKTDIEQQFDGKKTHVVKSVKKLHFEKFTFEQILEPNNADTRNKAIGLFLDELEFASTVYDRMDHIQIYGLGKLLMSGFGISSYILRASGAPGANLLDRKVFAVAKAGRAAVICLGSPIVDDAQLLAALNGAFRAHQIQAYDLLGMVDELGDTGKHTFLYFISN